jgi:hypothetical protein
MTHRSHASPSFLLLLLLLSAPVQAHFDHVSSSEGRAYLYGHGLNPYLVRVSIGCEPVEDIVGAFRAALKAAGARLDELHAAAAQEAPGAVAK